MVQDISPSKDASIHQIWVSLCVDHASQATQIPLHMPLVYNLIIIQHVQKQIKKIEIVYVKNCGPNHNLGLGIGQKSLAILS